MKLVVIWLFGVPLAVGAMLATAALWPREVSAARQVQRDAVETVAASTRSTEGYLEQVLPAVRP